MPPMFELPIAIYMFATFLFIFTMYRQGWICGRESGNCPHGSGHGSRLCLHSVAGRISILYVLDLKIREISNGNLLCILHITILSHEQVERTGRRIMLSISAVGVFTSATVLGICFYIHDHPALPLPIPTTSVVATSTIASTTSLAKTTSSILTTASFNQSFATTANMSSSPDALLLSLSSAIGVPSIPPLPPVSPILSYVALISAMSYMASYSLGYGPLPWVCNG